VVGTDIGGAGEGAAGSGVGVAGAGSFFFCKDARPTPHPNRDRLGAGEDSLLDPARAPVSTAGSPEDASGFVGVAGAPEDDERDGGLDDIEDAEEPSCDLPSLLVSAASRGDSKRANLAES
jgi:hypothetical protein